MNNSVNIPHGLLKFKKERKNLLRILELLFPNGADFSNLPDNVLSDILNGRLTQLESKVDIIQLQMNNSKPITERMTFNSPVLNFTVAHSIDENAPMFFVYESLLQKYDIDFSINGNMVEWINNTDTLIGYVEFTYYKL